MPVTCRKKTAPAPTGAENTPRPPCSQLMVDDFTITPPETIQLPEQKHCIIFGAALQGAVIFIRLKMKEGDFMWIKPTAAGKIRYCERYIDYLTGKCKDVSVTFEKDTLRNRKLAQKILQERIAAKQSPKVRELTMSDLIEEYRKDQKLNVKMSTYQRNYHTAESIMALLGKDVLVDRISARYVRNKFLQSGKRGATLNEYLKRLGALFRWAYKNDLVSDISFLDKIERFSDVPHKTKIADKYLESDELRLVLIKMEHPFWPMLVEFMALSGLRCGEAIALEKSDIDLKENVIHVSKTYDSINKIVSSAKTDNSIDDVVIQPQLKDCIRRINAFMTRQSLRNGYKTNLFMSDKNGKPVHYDAFNKYFRENCEAIIGKRLTTHSLRHTHASLLFEQGFTLDEVSRRLRHGDSKITRDVYIHVTKKLREKDASKLMAVNLI